MPEDVIDAPQTPALPASGTDALFPVRRVHCIGRNAAAHAIERGHDPDCGAPFSPQKNHDNLNPEGRFPYRAQSSDVRHEVEMAGRPWEVDKVFECAAPIGSVGPVTAR